MLHNISKSPSFCYQLTLLWSIPTNKSFHPKAIPQATFSQKERERRERKRDIASYQVWLPSREGNSFSRYREFSRPVETLFTSISGFAVGQGKRKHTLISCTPVCCRPIGCYHEGGRAATRRFSTVENRWSDAPTILQDPSTWPDSSTSFSRVC